MVVFIMVQIQIIQLIYQYVCEICFQLFMLSSNFYLVQVFVSIKGIYYQADIKGETITWVVSHKRGYEVKFVF